MNEEQRRQAERWSSRLHILEARRLEGTIPELGHIPSDAAVYITVNMDGFDPAFAPGVSHPVPGGLTARQILGLTPSEDTGRSSVWTRSRSTPPGTSST